MDLRKIKQNIKHLIARSVQERVFSGASVGVSFKKPKGEDEVLLFSYGTTDFFEQKQKITSSTYFDLASLTKPLVTTLCLAVLIDKGKLSLETNVFKIIKPIQTNSYKNITIGNLLSHCSGLPAHRPFFTRMLELPMGKRQQSLLKWISEEGLLSTPGTVHVYSDLGYILLGKVIEEISYEKIDFFWKENIARPLGLEKKFLFGTEKTMGLHNCAVTGSDPWTKKIICGVVHDDNCRLMGGTAGHAGLFGTIEGVVELCLQMMNTWHDRGLYFPFSANTLRLFWQKKEGTTWLKGFDSPSPSNSSSGKYFQHPSVGHLGFTGTSFWMDLQREIIVVFLTNRVLSAQNNEKIRVLRPLLHDTVLKELV